MQQALTDGCLTGHYWFLEPLARSHTISSTWLFQATPTFFSPILVRQFFWCPPIIIQGRTSPYTLRPKKLLALWLRKMSWSDLLFYLIIFWKLKLWCLSFPNFLKLLKSRFNVKQSVMGISSRNVGCEPELLWIVIKLRSFLCQI